MPPKGRAPARPRAKARAGNGAGHADAGQIARLEDATREPLGEVVADAEAIAQAEFEGVARGETITFMGERFRVAEKVGYMAMLKFAHAAASGADSADAEGMAAMYDVLRSCIHRGTPACGKCAACLGNPDADPPVLADPAQCAEYDPGDWDRFEAHAIEACADDEDLLNVVQVVTEIVAARPTQRRSGSSPRAPSTSPNLRVPRGGRVPEGLDGMVSVDDLAR